MKKIIYYCDRCHREIDGRPVKLVVERWDEDGFVVEFPEDIAKAYAADLSDKDYCVECFETIAKLIMPEEFDTAEEPEPIEEEPEPDKPKRKRAQNIDMGKVGALYRSGKNAQWIADDMGISVKTIYNALTRLRKAGEIE